MNDNVLISCVIGKCMPGMYKCQFEDFKAKIYQMFRTGYNYAP